MDICEGGEDKIYVVYEGKGSEQPFLAEVPFDSAKLVEAGHVLGNGRLYKGKGSALRICDDRAVYSCELSVDRLVKLFDFAGNQIQGDRVQAMFQNDRGEITLVSWELLNQSKPVEIITLREAARDEEREAGKQKITILCENTFIGEDKFGEAIVDFNKQSTDYEVVLEEIPINGSTEEDIYALINARLLGKESADILYMLEYQDIGCYQPQGLLEDIWYFGGIQYCCFNGESFGAWR